MKPFYYYDLNRWTETRDEIMRCPTCHRIPIVDTHYGGVIRLGRVIYNVECPECRVSGPTELTQKEAIKSWNKFVNRSKKEPCTAQPLQ